MEDRKTLTQVLLGGADLGDVPCWTFVPEDESSSVEAISFGAFVEGALRVAAGLREAGLEPSDRVILAGSPSREWVCAFAGVILAGGVAVPLNHRYATREFASAFETMQPSFVLFDSQTETGVRAAQEVLDPAPRFAGIGDFGECMPLDASAVHLPAESDAAVIVGTSGTTGRPKGVVRTHGQYARFLEFWSTTAMRPDDRILNFLPMYHQGGLVLSFLSAYMAGAPTYHLEKFSTRAFWSAIRRFSLTWATLMQPVPRYLLDEPPSASDRDHTMRWVLATAPAADWIAIQERFGIAFNSSYGSTETTVVRLTGSREDGFTSPQRIRGPHGGALCGRAIPGWADVRISSDDGAPVPPNELGAIEVRGVPVVEEYFGDRAATEAAFTPDGWFRTGDVGYITEDEELYIVDRARDRIRRSGENIAPREIEDLLEEHPAVAQAAVVAVPDPLRGEEIRACIVLEPGAALTAHDLFDFCAANLTPFKVPRYLEFRDDLPRTPTMKVRKDALIAEPNGAAWIDRLAEQQLSTILPTARRRPRGVSRQGWRGSCSPHLVPRTPSARTRFGGSRRRSTLHSSTHRCGSSFWPRKVRCSPRAATSRSSPTRSTTSSPWTTRSSSASSSPCRNRPSRRSPESTATPTAAPSA
jgi:acyl-CoA synthetase (AMP-forming)/AMP-acid ligase II